MKLLVHIGLHKTGSTYLQQVMNSNHRTLARHGLWYEPQQGYPAHHHAAWQLLLGKGAALAAMIDNAGSAGCDTVVLSSEDLESVFHDPRAIDAILATARTCGIDDVAWHVVLRDMGACFASLYAQLHHHIYADATQMFYDVMRRGFIHIDQPMPRSGTPYWYFSFDHARDLARLESCTGQSVFAHDFREADPFPGWRLLAMIDKLTCLEALPGPDARNARLPDETVADNYLSRLIESVATAFLAPGRQLAMIEHFITAQQFGQACVASYAGIVGEHCGRSTARALARHGVDRVLAARADAADVHQAMPLRKQA